MKGKMFRKITGTVLSAALVASQLFSFIPASAEETSSSTLPDTSHYLLHTFDNDTGIEANVWGTSSLTVNYDSSCLSLVEEEGRGKVLRFNKEQTTSKVVSKINVNNDGPSSLEGVASKFAYHDVVISYDYKIASCSGGDFSQEIRGFHLDYTPYTRTDSNNNYAKCNRTVNFNGSFTSAEEPEKYYGGFRTIADGNWHTISYAATIGSIERVSRFNFTVAVNADAKADIYLDNIKITYVAKADEYSAETKNAATVVLVSNGGTPYDIMGGAVGDKMTLPTPTKEDAEFVGWYSDAACTQPAGDVFVANTESWSGSEETRTNAVTRYYAKWSTKDYLLHTFDNDTGIEANVWGTSSLTVNYDSSCLSLVEEEGRGKVLRFNKEQTTSKVVSKINVNNDGPSSLEGVASKFAYHDVVISYDYKIASCSGGDFSQEIRGFHLDYTPYTRTDSNNNYAKCNRTVNFNGSFTSAEEPEKYYGGFRTIADGNWHTISYAATIGSIERVSRFNFTVAVNADAKADIYLDNIKITYVAKADEYSAETKNAATVVLVSSGGTPCDIMGGAVGDKMTLPTVEDGLVNEGHSFGGWYCDTKFTQPAGDVFVANTESWSGSESTLTNAVTRYYAKWIISEEYGGYKTMTEDFEKYDDTYTIDLNFLDTEANHQILEIVEEDGNKYFRYSVDKDAISSSNNFKTNFVIYDKDDTEFNGLNQYVSENATYNVLITYKYKINTAGTTDNWGVCLSPRLIDANPDTLTYDTLGDTVGNSIIRLAKNDYHRDAGWYNVISDNEWHTASLVVTLKSTYTGYASFGFDFNAGKRVADICLDDITVNFLEPGDNYSNFTVDTNWLPFAYNTVAGKVGEPVNIELPINLYKRSAKFIGWTYEDGSLYTADDTFGISNAVVTPSFEDGYGVYDYNYDSDVNILDIVRLKKSLSDASGYSLTVSDPAALLADLRKTLLSVDTAVTVGDSVYSLVYADEFNSAAIDSSVWGVDELGEGAYSYDPETGRVYRKDVDKSLLNISDGNAVITYARTETSETADVYSYEDSDGNTVYAVNPTDTTNMTLVETGVTVYNSSSANFSSKGNMKYMYGYLEARVKLPGDGISAALWLSNNVTNGELFNEVDIYETMNSNRLFANIHSWNWNDNQYHVDWAVTYGFESRNLLGGENRYDKDRYYTLGFEWKEDVVVFYVDGVEALRVERTEENAADFAGFNTWPLDIRIGSGLYNNNQNIEDASYMIDYIRIYQNADCADNQFIIK